MPSPTKLLSAFAMAIGTTRALAIGGGSSPLNATILASRDMPRDSAFAMAIGTTQVPAVAGGLSPLNATVLATRGDIRRDIMDSYQYKQMPVVIWIPDHMSQGCPETGGQHWIKGFHPQVPGALDTVIVVTCHERPAWVQEWSFELTDTCADDTIMRPAIVAWFAADGLGTERIMIDGVEHDLIKKVEVTTCVRHSVDYKDDCWGEWINKPVWDYEWQIRVPWDGLYDKEVCGAKLEQAIKDECAPFEQTLFECEPHPPGAWIKVRHSLLCGRTRITNAIKKGSNNEWNARCPYFVEVPVPK